MRVLFAGLLLIACGPKEKASLVDADLWTRVPLTDDPFASSASPGECPEAAVGFEELGGEPSLGVDGRNCVFVTVWQPTLVEVEDGDLLHYRLWHFELVGLGVATATITLTIDGHTVIDEHVPVPSPSALIAPYFEAGFAAAAGSEILFHVENHGSNSYNLIELTRGGDRPSD